VAQICARLDGLPLAIELAAARLSVLSAEGIARRLDDRFRLLSGGARSALPRQQTLRATMDWSYSLLDFDEQALLRRLAVFAGGFTLEAVESICGGHDVPHADSLDHLDSLVQKSLVIREESDETRYRTLETIRQYAREKLVEYGEEPEVLGWHASYFAAFADEAGPQLVGPEQAAWTRRLQSDLDNIRGALRWARESEAVEPGLRLVASIWRYWVTSGQSAEGRRWLTGLLALDDGAGGRGRSPVPTAVHSAALYAAGSLAFNQSDPTAAKQFFARSLELRRTPGDTCGIAEALNGLGVASVDLGEYREAEQYFEESVRLRFEIGDAFGTHAPLSNMANIAKYHGDYVRAAELYQRALEIQRRFGHTSAIILSLNNLAQLCGEQGEYDRASRFDLEALALARERDIVTGVVKVLGTLGSQALEQGRFDEADARLAECIELCRSIGDRIEENTALINLAEVALGRGDPDRAAALAGDALSHLQLAGHRRGQAFALATLSDAARMRGELDRAAALLAECLELRREMGDALGTVVTLEGRARLAMSRRQFEEAARLYGSASARRIELGTPLPPYWREAYARDIEQLRASLGADAFQRLWDRAMSSEL
jgi:tetratricopeptide (TPR) repeat protein